MSRTANLIKEVYKYSEKVNKKEIGEIMVPIFLIYFQQWNFFFIKTHKKENFEFFFIEEHKTLKNKVFFKKAERDFVFNKKVQPYIKKMGFSRREKYFMNLYMLLSRWNLNILAVKVRSVFYIRRVR